MDQVFAFWKILDFLRGCYSADFIDCAGKVLAFGPNFFEQTVALERVAQIFEQQRVGIARAFANQPAILFADEPTGNLDRGTGSRIAELLIELNQERGTTLVVVTHDAELAAKASRIVHLDDGRIHAIETTGN